MRENNTRPTNAQIEETAKRINDEIFRQIRAMPPQRRETVLRAYLRLVRTPERQEVGA